MEFILITVLAGLVGTAGMTSVLQLITRSGWTNADMVRALGSALTGSYEKSKTLGLVVHFLGGIPIAILYSVFLNLLPLTGIVSLILIGGVIGFVHGFVFSFVLMAMSEYHPVEQFKEADFQVAIAHIAGHVAYGLLVGAVIGISGYRIIF